MKKGSMKAEALKMIKDKKGADKAEGAEDSEKTDDEMSVEGESVEGGPEQGDPMDLSAPDAPGGEPGGAEDGVESEGADMAEEILPEGADGGAEGTIIADVLGIDPTAGKRLLDAALQIPAYAAKTEQEIADLMDRDMNVRMRVEMMAAKMPEPEMGGEGEDMAPDMGGMGAPGGEMPL